MFERALIAAVLALLVLAPAAQADADPASDVLLDGDVYLPTPRPSRPVARALAQVVREAHTKGYALKVAVIAGPLDLGGVQAMFGRPQPYADFLAKELSLPPSLHGAAVGVPKVPLLVVMPGGFGVHGAPRGVVQKLEAPPGGADFTAKAAIRATLALAGDAGHPLKAPDVPGGLGGSSDHSALAIAGVLAGLLAAGLGAALWKRRSA